MKITLKILISLVVIALVLIVIRHSLILKITRSAVLKTTGFDIEIGRLYAGLAEPVFEVTEARLINPEDFPEATALEIKTLRVGYDIWSLLSDEVHLREVVVDVPRAVLVIREDGESNLSRLGKKLDEPKGDNKQKETEEKPPADQREQKPSKRVRVDTLTLKIGRVEVRRYREGESKPEVKVYNVNFERTATDVRDLETINAMITAGTIEALGKQVLQGLGQFLQERDGDLKKAGEALQKAADKVADRLRRMAEGPKQSED